MLGSQSLQTLCRFPSGDNVTGQWQGDGEERKELRFILELEPIGHADASWKEDQGEKSKETSSPWGRKEPDAASSLISRVSALGCLDDAKGRSPELTSSLAGVSEDPLVHQALPSCWSL